MMKLEEIHTIITENKDEKGDGTYAGYRFSDDTIESIQELQKEFNIPNKVPKSKLHSTLLFSRKQLPKYEPLGRLDKPLVGMTNECDLWDTSGDNPKKALVLKFDCAEQDERHKALMDEHKATWDYDDYIPHLTLSYDVGDDFDLDGINNHLQDNGFQVELVEEYSTPLDLNWA